MSYFCARISNSFFVWAIRPMFYRSPCFTPNKHMTLSIITVTYNAGDLLEKTFENVFAQDWKDIEYIVIDGASKDNTLDVIHKYADRLSYWVSERDKGLYDAMNKGLAAAKGDYVCFLNAGDLFHGTQNLARAMKEGSGADLIYGKSRVVHPDGTSSTWHKATPTADALNAKSFMTGMIVCHQAMLVKRSCTVTYDLSWRIAADIDWCIGSMKNVKTKYCLNEGYLIDFLGGGVSSRHRWLAVRERFQISLRHFGLFAALWSQIKVVFGWLGKKG